MTEEDPIPIPAPAFEGDFVINEVLSLESGEILVNPTLHYAVYGQLNADRSNAVLVCHALSGSALVGTWWPQLFLPGGMLDLERDCVIGINIFGSCYGSTGPGSIDPATGKLYGPTFPLISIRDIVNAQVKLIDHLGIDKLKLAIGASIGGMQVLEWAILFPERVSRAISIGVAPLGAMGLGLNHLQRQAIMLDPAWNGGYYEPGTGPKGGLALARALGMVSYKSVPLLEERFARKPNRYGDENPYLSTTAGQNGRFDVAGYLDYQGSTFIARFDPHAGGHRHRLALPARGRPLARRHHPGRRHPLRLPRDGLQPRPRRLPRRARPTRPPPNPRLRIAPPAPAPSCSLASARS